MKASSQNMRHVETHQKVPIAVSLYWVHQKAALVSRRRCTGQMVELRALGQMEDCGVGGGQRVVALHSWTTAASAPGGWSLWCSWV